MGFNMFDLTSIDNADISEQDILLDFYILSMCNLKCKYCIAQEDRKREFVMKKDEIDNVINAIKISKRKFKITVLGGEPFLHPLLSYVIDKLIELENVEKIWIFTNGTKYKHLRQSDKLILSISYHIWQKIPTVLKFIADASADGQNINLSVMGYKVKRNFKNIVNLINKAKELDKNLIVDLEPIIDEVEKCKDLEYLEELLPYQNSDDAFIYNGEYLNVLHIYDKLISKEIDLEDYYCYCNRYFVGKNLEVNNYCLYSQADTLMKNPYYFRDVVVQKYNCDNDCNRKCILDQDIGNPKYLKSR